MPKCVGEKGISNKKDKRLQASGPEKCAGVKHRVTVQTRPHATLAPHLPVPTAVGGSALSVPRMPHIRLPGLYS
jgi:hypothetical protein